ncbi:uncharacterized protein LOC110095300 [Dendrobium catenatum]|uniref:uncharacterized protein LOC110095300 n=1 Tax=Dendrobium catenatum TaxID=906689 RepID=UPI0010A03942|nr:uncharacterized protein LOC110095300 [Dendrobium catenatum]
MRSGTTQIEREREIIVLRGGCRARHMLSGTTEVTAHAIQDTGSSPTGAARCSPAAATGSPAPASAPLPLSSPRYFPWTTSAALHCLKPCYLRPHWGSYSSGSFSASLSALPRSAMTVIQSGFVSAGGLAESIASSPPSIGCIILRNFLKIHLLHACDKKEDNKVVVKRKTELGGTFSMASWVVFVGLLSALLYQMITKRSIEVQRVIPANAPDLQSFLNDLEFNITVVSSMSCSQLRGLDTLVIGTPGSIEYRVLSLSSYVDYQCKNTSSGPTITLKCTSCQIPRRNHYISWQFVDILDGPAMAVGFQFNITSKDHNNDRHMSFVSGTVIANNHTSDKPRTYRGADLNILDVHLFPQIHNKLHDLKLIKPLVHDFVSGSSFSEVADLQASLMNPKDGLINTTLRVSYLSDYIVEIDNENVMGPVSFLANVGGIYAVSIAIFLYLLVQCEARFKKLRNEDSIIREIKSRTRARHNWEKNWIVPQEATERSNIILYICKEHYDNRFSFLWIFLPHSRGNRPWL